jgi:hypothetical protein
MPASLICNYGMCMRRPLYGRDNEYATRCLQHKNTNMNFRPSKCEKCQEYATHGKAYSKYCCGHAPAKMRFLLTCVICKNAKATHKFASSEIPTHCAAHVEYGMIKHTITDIIKCSQCNEEATHGYLFEEKSYCGQHSQISTGGLFQNNNPKCRGNNCPQVPYYASNDMDYPLRCQEHKLHSDINIIERKCSSCSITCFIRHGQQMCEICAKAKLVHGQERKEIRILGMLKSAGIKFIHNKSVQDNTRCSKYRPDFIITQVAGVNTPEQCKLILEVDEDQHRSYLPECEQARMKQIYFDYGGHNVIFIRYNPDSKHKYKERHLIEAVTAIHSGIVADSSNNIGNSHALTVHYLFYDNKEYEQIDPYA